MPDKTYLKFRQFCSTERLLLQDDKILVALSGGSDSVLLLYFLEKISKKLNLSLLAVHVNHGLRGDDADRDMQFCSRMCRSMGVDFLSVMIDVQTRMKESGISVEMAARELRYRALEDIRTARKFDKIATGHNIDDNAETVLINLVKGKGPEAVAGIPVRRGPVIRPMLSLNKIEIESWLQSRGVEWVEDKSNSDTSIQRNFMRHKVIPLLREINPDAANAIFANSKMLRSLLETVSDVPGCTSIDGSGRLLVDTVTAAGISDHFLYREISIRLIENFQLNLKLRNFNSLKKLIEDQPGRGIALAGGLSAFREQNRIVIWKSALNATHPAPLKPGESVKFGRYSISCYEVDDFARGNDKNVAWIDAGKISGTLTVKCASKGDAFHPLNGKGSRKISDFFNDVKLPSLEKWSHPVVYDEDKIVWVCGLRADDRYKVTEQTKKIYKIEIKEDGQNHDQR